METSAIGRVTLRRAQDPGDAWTTSGPPLPNRNLHEVAEVLDGAQALLESGGPALAAGVVDFNTASAALSKAWQLIHQALLGSDSSAKALVGSTDLIGLLDRMKSVDRRLHDTRVVQRDSIFQAAQQGLARLGGITAVTPLIDQAPQAVCRLGFDRAIISGIQESCWITEAMCVPEDPEWAAEILRVGQEHPRRVTSLLYESEIVRRRAPMVVTNVQTEQNVHREIADASLARSYAAAPIMPEGRVIGFLHADCYFQRRHVDQFDQDLLGMFAVGFGYLLQRNVLLERLQAARADIFGLGGRISSVLDEHLGADLLLARGIEEYSGGSRMAATRPLVTGDSVGGWTQDSPLTRRELDVLKLMAAGETNARIATRLVLSEGTVKSHVKHILRKLGAANRAEAVSRWIQLECLPTRLSG
jgi:DNA-binding CsgD family transcriptional regulator